MSTCPMRPVASFTSLVARLGLGGLLVFSALMKLGIWNVFGLLQPMTPRDFAPSIDGFKLGIPAHAIVTLAFVIPWTELLAGLALLLGFWTRSAALIVVVMMLAFIAGILSAMDRGLALECTCFGAIKMFCTGKIGMCHVVRNGVLGVAGLWLLAAGGGMFSLDRALRRGR